MGVAVYPRLGTLLKEKALSVAELGREIEQQFGLPVDVKTLYRLAHEDEVQRADLRIAGAAAAVLGVTLNDLFEVQTRPDEGDRSEEEEVLSADESARLAALFDQQSRRALSRQERQELEQLVAEYGRRLHARRITVYARARGLRVEDAEGEAAKSLDEAMGWWRAFQANPRRRRSAAEWAKRRREHPNR